MLRAMFILCVSFVSLTLCACGHCVQGNCSDGVGTYQYGNLGHYTGQFKGGKQEGEGTGVWTLSGQVYVGQWKNGRPNGMGTVTWPGGKELIVTFVDGQPNGLGTFTWENYGKFTGQFVNGKRNGFGILTPRYGKEKRGIWADAEDIENISPSAFERMVASSITQAQEQTLSEFDKAMNDKARPNTAETNSSEELRKRIEAEKTLASTATIVNDAPVAKQTNNEAVKGKQLVANVTGRRHALVIGNSAYRISPLKNPANDALDMAVALRKVGFDVTLMRDATQQQMENAVREFGLKLRQGGTGLFYYAGHGIQVAGENYLVPVNAVIQTEGDVKFGSLPAGLVLAKMEDAGNDINIVILDACRNNAFSRNFRNSDQGLAKMDAPTGSLISYATAPGSVASDGAGRNGLFTQHLLKNMATPGLPITEMFMRVRQGVVQETKKKQVPWESSSLIGQFYFSE